MSLLTMTKKFSLIKFHTYLSLQEDKLFSVYSYVVYITVPMPQTLLVNYLVVNAVNVHRSYSKITNLI